MVGSSDLNLAARRGADRVQALASPPNRPGHVQLAVFIHSQVYDATIVPRPFGVPLRGSWGGWSMPSIEMLALTGIAIIALYTMVPEGRLRNRLKWVAAPL